MNQDLPCVGLDFNLCRPNKKQQCCSSPRDAWPAVNIHNPDPKYVPFYCRCPENRFYTNIENCILVYLVNELPFLLHHLSLTSVVKSNF